MARFLYVGMTEIERRAAYRYYLRQGLPPARDFGFSTLGWRRTTSDVVSVGVHPSGDRAAFVSRNGSAGVDNVAVVHGLNTTPERQALVSPVSLILPTAGPATRDFFILTGSSSQALSVYAWDTLAALPLNLSNLGTPSSVALSPDGVKLAVIHATSPYLREYTLPNGTFRDISPATHIPSSSASALYTQDGAHLVVVATGAPALRVYDATTLALVYSRTATQLNGFQPLTNCTLSHHPTKPNVLVAAEGAVNTGVSIELDIPAQTHTVLRTHSAAMQLAGPVLHDTVNRHVFMSSGVNATSINASADFSIHVLNEDLSDNVVARDTFSAHTPYMRNPYLTLVDTDRHHIYGTVRDIDNNPAPREVWAYRRSDGLLMARTLSDAGTGDYELIVPDAGPYDVQFRRADGELLNDIFYAAAIAEPVP